MFFAGPFPAARGKNEPKFCCLAFCGEADHLTMQPFFLMTAVGYEKFLRQMTSCSMVEDSIIYSMEYINMVNLKYIIS